MRTGGNSKVFHQPTVTDAENQDLVKVRGWQVAPAELEAILLSHPSVINCAVVGIPVPESTGEVPRAYVQSKPKPSPEHAAASYGVPDEKKTTEEDFKQ